MGTEICLFLKWKNGISVNGTEIRKQKKKWDDTGIWTKSSHLRVTTKIHLVHNNNKNYYTKI